MNAAKAMGFRIVRGRRDSGKKEVENCNVYWIDVATVHDRLRSIQPWQCINHFPGMGSIANKARMNYTLNRMARGFPKEYAFYPRTWCLPTEIDTFKTQFDPETLKSNKMFIIK